jgi:hypothetical protein
MYKDSKICPFNNKMTARVAPQEGHGKVLIFFMTQSVIESICDF